MESPQSPDQPPDRRGRRRGRRRRPEGRRPPAARNRPAARPGGASRRPAGPGARGARPPRRSAAAAGPRGRPSYGGPVPAGGWQQPIAQQRPAGAGSPWRAGAVALGATLIDWLVLLVPVIVLTIIVVAVAAGSDTGRHRHGDPRTSLTYLVVALVYAPVLMARDGEHNGQTWGKQMLGIRVVRDNGAADELRLGRPARDRGEGPGGLHRVVDHPDHPLVPELLLAALG